jgi:hypothetical protein
MAATPTAVQRLKQVRKEWPEAAVLAEPLALAVRIEPELLRDVRLALLPASHASLEADLYFSPLISQRTPEWLSIDPPLAHALQKRLAARIRRGGKDEERVRRMRAMVERAHFAVPFEIAREEQIIWISVEQAGGKIEAQRAVNQALRDVLMRILQGSSEVSIALARWFAGAAKRMPPLARETESFALLVFASSSILGGRKIEAQVNATLDTFKELARYLPQSAKRVKVWGALTTRGLHLRPEQYAGYQQVELPLTDPILLEARPENGNPTLVKVRPGQPEFVPLPAGMVALRTLCRDLLTFRPRAVTPSRTEAVRTEYARESLHIYITHAKLEYKDKLFLDRLASDLRAIGHLVLVAEPGEGVGDWIRKTDYILVILTSETESRPWAQQELAVAESGGSRRIDLLRRDNSATTRAGQSRAATIDFREPRPYHEAFEELQAKLYQQPSNRPDYLSETFHEIGKLLAGENDESSLGSRANLPAALSRLLGRTEGEIAERAANALRFSFSLETSTGTWQGYAQQRKSFGPDHAPDVVVRSRCLLCRFDERGFAVAVAAAQGVIEGHNRGVTETKMQGTPVVVGRGDLGTPIPNQHFDE